MTGPEGKRGGQGLARTLARGMGAGAAALLLGACAMTGSTVGSGVGDRLLRYPPYVAGEPSGVDRIAHLPIAYQRGGAQEPMFDPSGEAGTPVAALLEEMNAYLDSLHASTRLEVRSPERGTPPDVQFGCEKPPFGGCGSESREVAVRRQPRMRLAVARPSASWVAPVQSALADAGADGVLVITLEVGEYWVRQKNLRGDKEVRLGDGYAQGLPWLTSLDQPVQVLQLTGALVDPDGRARRIGAEGLLARRTPLLASALGAQGLVRDEEVQALRTRRRDDLSGSPLVWQVALRELVAELTGRGDLAAR
ncbi:MAG: hypothetical protein JO040_11225 [Gemmatimonadetes bacterium]|nr:hypothetical protein [Gemmatimonadota bacterium]